MSTSADIIRTCRELLRIDTSNPGSTEEAAARYVVDRLSLAGVPCVVLEPAPGRCSVIATHRGTGDSRSPLLIHGHLDVVPPQSEGWTYDPFGGVEADGMVWGRGAVDMKGFIAMMLACQLELAECLLRPRRDLVFAYFADEEMGGAAGARWIVANRPDVFAGADEAIGEGGGFSATLADGRRVYALAEAERGKLWLRITARGSGGHAAFTDARNPLVRLAELTARIATLQVPDSRLETFMPSVGSSTAMEALGEMAARGQRTTFQPTVMRAGGSVNVLPDCVELCVDCRFVPGSEDAALAALHGLLDPEMELEVLSRGAGLVTRSGHSVPAAIARAVAAADTGARVVPYLMPAGSDAKHLAPLGIATYGFTPLVLPAGFDVLAQFHAPDERVPASALKRGYEVLRRIVAGS